ncbi:MAG: hypothetical protein WC514_01435 [Candidatus Paceibacterota bacterium]
MRKEYKKSDHFSPAEPSAGLFDRIILAIKKEQELQNKRRLLFSFFSLLIVSISAVPFSWTILAEQVRSSGILYFVSAALNNLSNFMIFGKDFGLALLESLPIAGIIFFTLNIILAVFTLRLFLYKKQFLFKYLGHNLKTA